MENMKVDINEVMLAVKKVAEYNSLDISEIDLYDGENRIPMNKIHAAECKEYGINLTSYISMVTNK